MFVNLHSFNVHHMTKPDKRIDTIKCLAFTGFYFEKSSLVFNFLCLIIFIQIVHLYEQIADYQAQRI